MQILVDADACPVVIREILYRAAQKRALKLTLFANQSFQVPASPLISLYQVAKGPDMADHEIAARVTEGDLVITADIPLASEVLEKGALVVTPRGSVIRRIIFASACKCGTLWKPCAHPANIPAGRHHSIKPTGKPSPTNSIAYSLRRYAGVRGASQAQYHCSPQAAPRGRYRESPASC